MPQDPQSGEARPSEISARLKQIRHVALDMDGTIYTGGRVFAATIPFLSLLDRLGIGRTFLTNNPSKSVADYLKHLGLMAVPTRIA